MQRRFLLVLVEGKSDADALNIPLGMFFDSIDSSIEVQVLDPVNSKGDITGSYAVEQNNVDKKIKDWWGIMDFLSKNSATPSDLLEIVQIIDVDGVYIPNESVICVPLLRKAEYCEDCIKCDSPQRIIDRNLRKKHNISALKSTNFIKIGNVNVKYSIYYFSCNMDHYTCGDRNLAIDKKRKNATNFVNETFDTPEDVYDLFTRNDCNKRINLVDGYKESWEYISKGKNSLQPCSNLGVLLKRYLEAKKDLFE